MTEMERLRPEMKKSSEMKQTYEVQIELFSPDGHGPALRVSSTARQGGSDRAHIYYQT
jgi:hypothetical protein